MILLLRHSQENIRGKDLHRAETKECMHSLSQLKTVILLLQLKLRFEELEVFLMATGKCSASASFNLLKTTSHRRSEHQSGFRKFVRVKYLLYFRLTKSYTVWRMQFFSSKTSFGAKTRMVSDSTWPCTRSKQQKPRLFQLHCSFLQLKSWFFHPPGQTSQKRKLVTKIGRLDFEKSRVRSHHF